MKLLYFAIIFSAINSNSTHTYATTEDHHYLLDKLARDASMYNKALPALPDGKAISKSFPGSIAAAYKTGAPTIKDVEHIINNPHICIATKIIAIRSAILEGEVVEDTRIINANLDSDQKEVIAAEINKFIRKATPSFYGHTFERAIKGDKYITREAAAILDNLIHKIYNHLPQDVKTRIGILHIREDNKFNYMSCKNTVKWKKTTEHNVSDLIYALLPASKVSEEQKNLCAVLLSLAELWRDYQNFVQAHKKSIGYQILLAHKEALILIFLLPLVFPVYFQIALYFNEDWANDLNDAWDNVYDTIPDIYTAVSGSRRLRG